MKKNVGVLTLFILLGWLIGAWIAKALQSFSGLSFLTRATAISWSPRADLDIISYNITVQLQMSLLSLIGIIAAVWLYRRL
ncbi:DUF4321 domain-containing protein [Paenibacillus sp. P96]|uniref:DUF4321 domain-containing protein n=1 Tax=Paenibacillus zeirhizosphaerae TaxID=2987519 RepID=A0ABT9FMN4_9BACL|nr:DUF4321 domain-containing protein [Paenibacillus sp. P96]MDP4095667.1 DUF4321 domain-containing protein [Paenibacillus sp. P96]